MEWDRTYRDLRRLNWLTLLIMSLISTLFMSRIFTLGVVLGGLIIIANFKVLQHTIRRGFSAAGEMSVGKLLIIMKYYLRLLALGVVIAFLIKRGWVDPVGLSIGLSTVVISVVGFGIKRAVNAVPREAA